MQVTLIGLGCGSTETMTVQAQQALHNADCVIGAPRLLNGLDCTVEKIEAITAHDIAAFCIRNREKTVCVVYSGDTGFYSGTKSLLPLLKEQKIEVEIIPGISSVQLLAARLGCPWQDWNLVSGHGVSCNVLAEVMQEKPTFLLTGGLLTAEEICRRLTDAGLGNLSVVIGENLSYPEECIRFGTAAEFAGKDLSPLAVMLIESAQKTGRQTAGFPDGSFVRGDVPMTKQEVRAACLGKLAIAPTDTVWDIGAGTGSVSVELALQARRGTVWAVECSDEGCALIRRNRERFGAWNLHLVQAKAPEGLDDLPVPDAVFIGGTKGNLSGILDSIYAKNLLARVCITAIAIETLGMAVDELTRRGVSVTVTQMSVSRSRQTGSLHLMLANNPVYLITGGCHA